MARQVLLAALKHCNVVEDLSQSPEYIKFIKTLVRLQPADHKLMGYVTYPKLMWTYQTYHEIGLETWVSQWLKKERYAATLFVLATVAGVRLRCWLLHLRGRKRAKGNCLPSANGDNAIDIKHVAALTISCLVNARDFDFALDMVKAVPEIAQLGTSASDLLVYAVSNHRLVEMRMLLPLVNAVEPQHSIIELARTEIARLEAFERLRRATDVSIDDLGKLSGTEFELLIENKLNDLGYQATRCGGSGDFGADVKMVTQTGSIVLFQCKRHQRKINLNAVQEVVGAMGYYGADFGVVITNNGFLNSARRLAANHDIELWSGFELARFLTGDVSFSELSQL